jgi:hypothetical protein
MPKIEVEVIKELLNLDSGRNQLRVQVVKYGGEYVRLDIRNYYSDEDGKLHPSQKGIALRLEHVEELGNVIQEAIETMREAEKG